MKLEALLPSLRGSETRHVDDAFPVQKAPIATYLISLRIRNKSAIAAGSPFPQTNDGIAQQTTLVLRPRT